MSGRRLGTLAIAAGLFAPPLAAERPVYAVVRIGSALSDDQIVGARKAGMMCLPNGPIRWSAVGAGSSTDQRETVQDALEDAGVAVVPFGEFSGPGGAAGTLRLRGVVTDAKFALCAKHWVLGDAKALSGEARLTVEWRIESRAEGGLERKHVSTVSLTADGGHAAPVAALYRQLLKNAAKDLAGWLASGQPADPKLTT